MKKNFLFFPAIYLLVIFLFFPAFFNFYSHDDFFHYKIAEAHSLKEFLSFFDLTNAPFGWGYYRPLTTQVLYFFGRTLFNFNSVIMHAFAFFMFFIVIFLVFKLILALTKNKSAAYFATFFYAVSATHFSHLYSIANQELGHAIFFLSSMLIFIKFLKAGTTQNNNKRKKLKYYKSFADFRKNSLFFERSREVLSEKFSIHLGITPGLTRTITGLYQKVQNFRYYLTSLLLFIIALTCKEFAIILPAALVLVYGLLKLKKEISVSLKKFILSLLPFLIVLGIYLYLHVFHYGLVQGESYIWVFTPRAAANTLLWYGLWSLNLPKMLAEFEFFGPGFRPNLNLFKVWPQEIIFALALFAVLLILLSLIMFISFKQSNKKERFTYLFSLAWFACSLLPVLFLPWHKFTTYLTIPLIGIVIILGQFIDRARSYLIFKKKKKLADFLIFAIFAIYIALSVVTLNITRKVDWIGTGPRTAKRVFDYFKANFSDLEGEMTVVFYDRPEDENLLLRPSNEVKLALSDNNFFAVFYPGEIKAYYVHSEEEIKEANVIKLPARQFVEY